MPDESPLTPSTVPDLETLRAASVRDFSTFVRTYPADFVRLLREDALAAAVPDRRPSPATAGPSGTNERTLMSPPATSTDPPTVTLAPREVRNFRDLMHEDPATVAQFLAEHPADYERLKNEFETDCRYPKNRLHFNRAR